MQSNVTSQPPSKSKIVNNKNNKNKNSESKQQPNVSFTTRSGKDVSFFSSKRSNVKTNKKNNQ